MGEEHPVQNKRCRAKVTGRHAITLPADLCRELVIASGDVVEFTLVGRQATLARVDPDPTPTARGLLRGYFPDWASVNRYVEEERHAWGDRQADPAPPTARPPRHAPTSTS